MPIPLSTLQKYFIALGDSGAVFQAMLKEVFQTATDEKDKK